MTIDLDTLSRICAAAPSGDWQVWTSNSWRRVLSSQAGQTVRVIEPVVQRHDNHPDLMFGPGVQEYLENVTPDVVAGLVREVRALRMRLEIDDNSPYDGIACRDETIRHQDKKIAALTAEVNAFTTISGDLNQEMWALFDKCERYKALCAAAYQLAGTMNAPVRFLDALSDGANGELEARAKTDDLLPVLATEVGTFPADKCPHPCRYSNAPDYSKAWSIRPKEKA
jgi:hypothetical protein